MSAESLCTACGLCCDGTLFGYVALASGDEVNATAAQLAVVPVEGGVGFLQPCPKLEANRCCAVYAQRPGACRRYRCATLRAFEAGAIDLATARARIDGAQAAIARLLHGLPDDATVPAIRRELMAAGAAGDPVRRVALGGLERLLDRHFRSPHQRAFKPDQAATAVSP